MRIEEWGDTERRRTRGAVSLKQRYYSGLDFESGENSRESNYAENRDSGTERQSIHEEREKHRELYNEVFARRPRTPTSSSELNSSKSSGSYSEGSALPSDDFSIGSSNSDSESDFDDFDWDGNIDADCMNTLFSKNVAAKMGLVRCNKSGPSEVQLKMTLPLPLQYMDHLEFPTQSGLNSAIESMKCKGQKDFRKHFDYDGILDDQVYENEVQFPGAVPEFYKSLFESPSEASSDNEDEHNASQEHFPFPVYHPHLTGRNDFRQQRLGNPPGVNHNERIRSIPVVIPMGSLPSQIILKEQSSDVSSDELTMVPFDSTRSRSIDARQHLERSWNKDRDFLHNARKNPGASPNRGLSSKNNAPESRCNHYDSRFGKSIDQSQPSFDEGGTALGRQSGAKPRTPENKRSVQDSSFRDQKSNHHQAQRGGPKTSRPGNRSNPDWIPAKKEQLDLVDQEYPSFDEREAPVKRTVENNHSATEKVENSVIRRSMLHPNGIPSEVTYGVTDNQDQSDDTYSELTSYGNRSNEYPVIKSIPLTDDEVNVTIRKNTSHAREGDELMGKVYDVQIPESHTSSEINSIEGDEIMGSRHHKRQLEGDEIMGSLRHKRQLGGGEIMGSLHHKSQVEGDEIMGSLRHKRQLEGDELMGSLHHKRQLEGDELMGASSQPVLLNDTTEKEATTVTPTVRAQHPEDESEETPTTAKSSSSQKGSGSFELKPGSQRRVRSCEVEMAPDDEVLEPTTSTNKSLDQSASLNEKLRHTFGANAEPVEHNSMSEEQDKSDRGSVAMHKRTPLKEQDNDEERVLVDSNNSEDVVGVECPSNGNPSEIQHEENRVKMESCHSKNHAEASRRCLSEDVGSQNDDHEIGKNDLQTFQSVSEKDDSSDDRSETELDSSVVSTDNQTSPADETGSDNQISRSMGDFISHYTVDTFAQYCKKLTDWEAGNGRSTNQQSSNGDSVQKSEGSLHSHEEEDNVPALTSQIDIEQENVEIRYLGALTTPIRNASMSTAESPLATVPTMTTTDTPYTTDTPLESSPTMGTFGTFGTYDRSFLNQSGRLSMIKENRMARDPHEQVKERWTETHEIGTVASVSALMPLSYYTKARKETKALTFHRQISNLFTQIFMTVYFVIVAWLGHITGLKSKPKHLNGRRVQCSPKPMKRTLDDEETIISETIQGYVRNSYPAPQNDHFDEFGTSVEYLVPDVHISTDAKGRLQPWNVSSSKSFKADDASVVSKTYSKIRKAVVGSAGKNRSTNQWPSRYEEHDDPGLSY